MLWCDHQHILEFINGISLALFFSTWAVNCNSFSDAYSNAYCRSLWRKNALPFDSLEASRQVPFCCSCRSVVIYILVVFCMLQLLFWYCWSAISVLDTIVEPIEKTISHKPKGDAVKQEVDRNEDMIRSALRAISSLSRIRSSLDLILSFYLYP